MANNNEILVRRPAVAGAFYPAEADRLRQAVLDAFRDPLGPGEAPIVKDGPRAIFGMVVPHAGYMYSAQGAAWAYRLLAEDGRPDVVVILGVNHRGDGAPLALSPASGWETPLGIMPVAHDIGQRLMALDPTVVSDAVAHAQEHSLEVQVPFLQVIFGVLPILPLAIGSLSIQNTLALGAALVSLAREYRLVCIASSDLSHYLPAEQAHQLDLLALSKVVDVDPDGLIDVVRRRRMTMCGVLPVAAMLAAAREFGIHQASLLHYHTSGDVSGDQREVVGYGTAVLYR